ncbi:MAG TPA: hypothetical protein VMV40_05240 [Acidiferrobacter sp.]|nr:hypothetical protein [Acidiferrobacter sp.]
MSQRQRNRHNLGRGACLPVLGAFLGLSVPVHAGVVNALSVGLPATVRPLPASVLRTLRGGYEAGNAVVYFGLQMVSRWTQADGASMAVGTNVSLGLKDGPHLSVSSFEGGGGTSGFAVGNTPGRSISGNPTQGVSGIGQSIQTTGDNNVISNRAMVNVVSNTGADAGGATTGPTNVVQTAGAALGSVTFRQNSVVVAINVTGQGLVQQTLGTQGLAQSAQVLSSANNILNQMVLSVGFSPITGLSGAHLQTILASMKGL